MIECCNQKKYEREQPQTHKELIHYIIKHKLSTCDELFARFPESNERSGKLYTRAYVFESLWKIIFICKLDNLAAGLTRNFKVSLEKNKGY